MTIRSAKESELEEMARLQQIVFRPKEPTSVERYMTYMRDDPSYGLDHSRVVVDNNRIVAHLRVWDRTLCIRGANLLAGGIGSLVVHPDCRGKGYAHALMRDTDCYFYESGYDFGLLFTIIGTPFYEKQGWTPILLPVFERDVHQVPLAPPDAGVVRSLDASDLKGVEEIYAQASLVYDGAVVRPSHAWLDGPSCIRGGFPKLGVERDGKFIAYATFGEDDEAIWIKEICAVEHVAWACEMLVRTFLNRHPKPRLLEGSLPPSHPFVKTLEFLTGNQVTWKTDDHMMVKLVNWKTMTEKLGGMRASVDPPKDERAFWLALFGLENSGEANIQKWLNTLPTNGEMFYWDTDVF